MNVGPGPELPQSCSFALVASIFVQALHSTRQTGVRLIVRSIISKPRVEKHVNRY